MLRKIRTFLNDQGGATAIEYALIAALFAIATITSARALGDTNTAIYQKITTAITEAIEGAGVGGGGGDGADEGAG